MASKTRPTLPDILETLKARLPDLKQRFGVRYLGLFGSYVRGEQKRSSDLDVLVEFADGAAKAWLGHLTDLEAELSRSLGVKVDLVPRGQLKPYVGRRVLEEVIDVERPKEGLARIEALRAEGKLSRPREIRDSLNDIVSEIGAVQQFVVERDYESFRTDLLRVHAVLHGLMIIGEATRNLTPEVRRRYPEVAWGKILGLRNRVAHAYFALDLPIIWATIHEDLPALRDVAVRMLADLEHDQA